MGNITADYCIKSSDGIYYYRCSKLHRDDEPAVTKFDGTKMWYKDGLLHRDNNLPAVIYPDGNIEYWLNGDRIDLLSAGVGGQSNFQISEEIDRILSTLEDY
jgi:hypothetical protein